MAPDNPGRRRLVLATAAALTLVVVALVLWSRARPARVSGSPPATSPPQASATSEPEPYGPFRFTDVTDSARVDHAYRNGEEAGLYAILESLGGGAGLLDFDGDGRLDLFLTGGGRFEGSDPDIAIRGWPDRLYRNEGGWRFRDVTAEVGLGGEGHYGHGCAAGDYDNDGDPDLLVTAYQGVTLYRNEAGRRFVDVTDNAGLRAPGWATAAAWADVDGDGRLDLYVVRYVAWSPAHNPPCRYQSSGELDVCAPSVFEGLSDSLYRNEGDGHFTDVSRAAGLAEGGKGLGVVACDLDGDRDVDLYVANDTTPNFLYLNRGDGTLEEVGVASGAGLGVEGIPTGSMGVDAGDFDGDGDFDLWVSNYEGETNELYRNDGSALFTPVGLATGLAATSRPKVGWGTGLVDFDNDGRLDVMVVNGHLMHRLPGTPMPQHPFLFRQEPGGRFADVGRGAGPYFAAAHQARGCAFGDLDDDGDTDAVVVHQNRRVALLRNDSQAGFSLRLRLEGRRSNRSAIGAVVAVSAGGRTMTRPVIGGGSYLSQSDLRLRIGLGADRRADLVEVRWPSGATDRHEGLSTERPWLLREGLAPVVDEAGAREESSSGR